MEHPLTRLLTDAALARRGQPAPKGLAPDPTDALQIFSAPPGPAMAIVGLPGSHIVASSASEQWLRERLSGDLMGPLDPSFITALAQELGRVDDGFDVVLAAPGIPGEPALHEGSEADHPRVARACAHRRGVQTFTNRAGDAVVAIGRGLADRYEVSIEVASDARGQGIARAALIEARRLISTEAALFAQAAPANAASVRALLGAGFALLGAEVLFFEGERATT